MDFNEIQKLLNEQAECRAKIKLIPFDGSIEVKEISGEKYLYARKREGGKNTSTYIDVYSDERFETLTRQAVELRSLKKDLRRIEKKLAELKGETFDINFGSQMKICRREFYSTLILPVPM